MFQIFLKMCGKGILFETRDNTNKENARAVSNAFSVLKSMHPHIAKSDKFTTNDCANILEHSLNKCTKILRASKHGVNTEQFKLWSESYYQSSLLLFSGKDGLTAYKMKMLLIPQIMDAGFVRRPWHHLC